MIPPTVDADREIARQLIMVDRQLWRTLTQIENVCADLFVRYIYKNPALSDMCQVSIGEIKKQKEGIVNVYKHKENKELFNWTT